LRKAIPHRITAVLFLGINVVIVEMV